MSQNEQDFETRSETKAKKFKLYKLIALSVLVAFLLGGLIIFENDITIENLRYLIKYLDFSSSGDFQEETVMYYNADPANRFYVFRGDLALVNSSGVTLYDRRGNAVMTDSFNMSNPVCVSGDRYLAIYDLGGYQVRIYNSFSLLFEKTFDYLVQSVSVNSDGDFCVVTSERSYHSAVFVYDRDFHQVQEWLSSDKFAVDACLSDQDVLTISTVRSVDGALACELIALEPDKKEPRYTYTFTDRMPLALSSDRKGTLLLTDENLQFIKEGKVEQSALFPGESLDQIHFGEKLCAVVQNELSVGVNYRLRVFDRQAKEIVSEKFSVSIRDIEIYDESVYVLTHTGLYVITEEGTKEYQLNGDYSDLGVFSKKTVILCSDNAANVRVLD